MGGHCREGALERAKYLAVFCCFSKGCPFINPGRNEVYMIDFERRGTKKKEDKIYTPGNSQILSPVTFEDDFPFPKLGYGWIC